MVLIHHTQHLCLLEGDANDLQVYTDATFESLLQEWIRYTAVSSTDGCY